MRWCKDAHACSAPTRAYCSIRCFFGVRVFFFLCIRHTNKVRARDLGDTLAVQSELQNYSERAAVRELSSTHTMDMGKYRICKVAELP